MAKFKWKAWLDRINYIICVLICTKILIKTPCLSANNKSKLVFPLKQAWIVARSFIQWREKKKEVSIACIHIQTCKHTQYAYNNAHTRRLMFIDITIIFVKQCITNWKSLDIFTFYLSGFWREFFFFVGGAYFRTK